MSTDGREHLRIPASAAPSRTARAAEISESRRSCCVSGCYGGRDHAVRPVVAGEARRHLVHHVGERQTALGVGEGDGAARPGVPETSRTGELGVVVARQVAHPVPRRDEQTEVLLPCRRDRRPGTVDHGAADEPNAVDRVHRRGEQAGDRRRGRDGVERRDLGGEHVPPIDGALPFEHAAERVGAARAGLDVEELVGDRLHDRVVREAHHLADDRRDVRRLAPREPDPEVEPEGPCDLVGDEPTGRSMLRVDAAHDLAGEPAERDGVVSVAASDRPVRRGLGERAT